MSAAQFVGHTVWLEGLTLTEAYELAVVEYKKMYGHAPKVVYLNPKDNIEEILKQGDSAVVTHNQLVLPDSFLIGKEDKNGNLSEL